MCKNMILHIISETYELALKILPEKYSSIGARVDNSAFIGEIDAPVDNAENEEDPLTFKLT